MRRLRYMVLSLLVVATFTVGCTPPDDSSTPEDPDETGLADTTEVLALLRGAGARDASGQYMLAESYALVEGVPQGHSEAVRWWLRAAEQGHARAQFF